jgi:hypothetical protein
MYTSAFRERLGALIETRTRHYVTQHPPAAAKNKFMEKHCGVFCSMAQVWEFVAEQAIEMILERHHGGCLYRLNDIEDIMKLVR